ncbi:MAG TPA: cytochrome c [Myxococcota bacterium]|nr:cytochrome c [Myxococcota bacterium]
MSRWLPALALAAFVAACGGSSEKQSAPPAAQPAPAPVVAPSPAPPPAVAPSQTPSGNLRGTAEAGKLLYAQYCTTCHGATGRGDGPAAAGLNPKPANHTDHVYMASLSDQHLYQVISKGGASVGKSAMMAPWGGVINDAGIKDLIAYLRQLSST